MKKHNWYSLFGTLFFLGGYFIFGIYNKNAGEIIGLGILCIGLAFLFDSDMMILEEKR
jgi:hypothetical protein